MTVEVHKIYPIGLLQDGNTYYVEVRDWGTATWAVDLWEFYEDDGPPTLRDDPLPSKDGWEEAEEAHQETHREAAEEGSSQRRRAQRAAA